MRRRPAGTLHGWLPLDKPVGITSTRALAIARSLAGGGRAGHGGTLDPMAGGVLPIAFGEATKTVSCIMDADKDYEVTIAWGVSTASHDSESECIGRSAERPGDADITTALRTFIGLITQVPPAFSAIKVNGVRSHALARQGKSVELAARKVTLHAAEMLMPSESGQTRLHLRCGKGFYVRSLVRDLAGKLGADAHVAALRRTRVGCFSQSDSKTLEKLERMDDKEKVRACVVPIRRALAGIPHLHVSDVDASCLRQGQSIVVTVAHLARLGVAAQAVWGNANRPRMVLAVEDSGPVALGEVGTGCFRPLRVFGVMKSREE